MSSYLVQKPMINSQDMPLVSVLETTRKIWTREDARLLAEPGFPNADKLELVDGELIQRSSGCRCPLP
jgi:hypothetical protein